MNFSHEEAVGLRLRFFYKQLIVLFRNHSENKWEYNTKDVEQRFYNPT